MDELIACMPMPKQILLNNEALKTELICERGAFHHYLSKLGLNADKTIWVNRILSFSLSSHAYYLYIVISYTPLFVHLWSIKRENTHGLEDHVCLKG